MALKGADVAVKLADLQGFHRGLEESKALFVQAARKDVIEE